MMLLALQIFVAAASGCLLGWVCCALVVGKKLQAMRMVAMVSDEERARLLRENHALRHHLAQRFTAYVSRERGH